MPGLKKDRRIATRPVGPVKIRGDKEAGYTLETHFFDDIVFVLDTTCNFGIQRTVVIGQTTENLEESFADKLFSAFGVGYRTNFGYVSIPFRQLFLRDLIHPLKKGILRRLLSGKRGETEQNGARRCVGLPFHKPLAAEAMRKIFAGEKGKRSPVTSPEAQRHRERRTLVWARLLLPGARFPPRRSLRFACAFVFRERS